MEDKQVKVEQVSLDDAANSPEQPIPEQESVTDTRIAELEKTLADVNDKYLRTAAELENTRRRAAIDSESRARARAMSVAEKILPVIDAVYAALKHTPDDEGIKSMARALESAFDSIGITRIESVGKVLNPIQHNAIQVVDVKDTAPNTIVEELQAGYMFGDTVLRTAMVVVAK